MAEHRSRILYVDDEEQNLVSFRAAFRRYYEVFTARSGKDAIEVLRGQEVDIIISDQRMPGMTGVQLLEQILQEFPDPIRMVLTGYSDVESIISAINKGKVSYYITKPWNQKELRLILENALESQFLKRENKRLIREKHELMLNAERQQKENILSQFESLKNQVNPHFLFNSLNALAALVHEDADLAERFITKLTKVYRYILEYRQVAVIALEEELRVIQDYCFLQEIRFGDSLEMVITIPEHYLSWQVPPLTIQMLVENAIKHNVVSRTRPLMVEVFVDETDYLVVRNNYQKREELVPSTGIGLRNLEGRYRFLTDRKPTFYLEDNAYIAKVPLLTGTEEERIMQAENDR
jgi:CheY-like chemotaxis protein